MMEAGKHWGEFIRSLTNGAVLAEYLDGLKIVEAYKDQHPEKEIPTPVLQALRGMRTVYDAIRPIVGNPALHMRPASPEVANLVLAAVRRVRLDVPVVEPTIGKEST